MPQPQNTLLFYPFPSTPRMDLRSPASAHLRRGLAVVFLRILLLMVLDALGITLAWIGARWYGEPLQSVVLPHGIMVLPILLAVLLGVNAAGRLYQPGDCRRNYIAVTRSISLGNLLLLMLAYFSESAVPLSRSGFLLFWLSSILLVCLGRIGFDLAVEMARHRGIGRYSIYLITDMAGRERNLQLLESQSCYNLLGVTGSEALDRANRDATFAFLRERDISEVFVSWSAIKNRLHLCWHFQTMGITLRILPAEVDMFLPRCEIYTIGNITAPTLHAPAIVGSNYWIKRAFDFLGAALLILLLSPIYVAIALLVRLDSPGPIFFRQVRMGLYGQEFKVWKFRTMVVDADKLQSTLEQQNEMKDGILFKIKDDPRITRIGKILRQYSLDELPQLFNVFAGEMSFVGPRPLSLRDVQRFKEKHFIRQEVLPGITGLWQVSGRSDIDNFDEAVRLDLTYIANWSLQLDLQILLKTVQVVFQKSGAY